MTPVAGNALVSHLEHRSRWVRLQVFESTVRAKKGHLGGTFSCTDLLVALYYGGIMRFNPRNPTWKERDRFLIGKGHACLALFHMWVDLGMLDHARLETYGTNGGIGGQLDLSIPGAEHNTGSLGHAIGIGAGLALAAKLDGRHTRTFAMIGDAECDEGAIWESIMFAAEHGLNNLIGIVDRNRLSVTDRVEDDRGSGKLEDKLRACKWECRVIDGHSFDAILGAFSNLDTLDKPLMIIADTVKGKGVSFMENGIKWHHSIPTAEEILVARAELGGAS
ncbi:MAG: transketolase [Sterolibacterium sp.]|jgi:transketolase